MSRGSPQALNVFAVLRSVVASLTSRKSSNIGQLVVQMSVIKWS